MFDFTQKKGRLYHDREGFSSEELLFSFCSLFESELQAREREGLDLLSLRTYYKNMFTQDNRLIPISAFGYSQRLIPAVDENLILEGKGRILDAGCGFGTESLLFSLAGTEVVGVDLVPERIDLARSRIKYYQSKCEQPLRLKFFSANIFRFLETSDPFDIIWLMEAISHIYPAEKFLGIAYSKLKEGGKIILTDPNSINPVAWTRSVKIRGSLKHSPHQKFKDPESGVPVEYGQERIYTVFGLKKILEKAGFKIKKTRMSGFMGTAFFPRSWLHNRRLYWLLSFSHKILRNFPLIVLAGATYTIVAVKEGQP
jgi:SAM-dependent methyltransferase